MSTKYDRKDHFYEKAKEEGYRSRAAYKLKELQKKFNIIKRGSKILDLGSWPGGWTQVSAELTGESGLVVSLDLKECDDFGLSNVKCVVGDARDDEVLQRCFEAAGGKLDLLLSDMSPKLTGIREVDHAASVGCAELARYVAQQALTVGGGLVIKVFKSNETEIFVKETRPLFNTIKREELDSTRKTSNEFYLVCLGFKGAQIQ